MSYSSVSLPQVTPYRATGRKDDAVLPGRVAADNTTPGDGSTDYGDIDQGTVMAKDSNGKLHPAGWQKCSAASATNTATVEDASNFVVGDTVEIRSNAGVYDAVTINAGDNPSTLDITANAVGDSGLSIALVDPSANSQPLSFSVADDSGDTLVSVSLATDGGGAITTTVAELAAYINANTIAMGLNASNAETGADVCQAVAATDLTGGLAQYGAVASARTVSSTTSTTVVFDGAAVDIAAGDHLLKTGAWQPAGFLDDNVHTKRYVGTTAVKSEQNGNLRIAGDVRSSQVTGSGEYVKEAMSGGPYTSPADGSVIVPPFEGFIFMDNV